ncbi:hypothetical protein SK128_002475 [Halocaridina rubra]|uniref:Cell cycle checkpoint protein RAD17 n=1 Tax=Halocaridina rubra TaxID=373956 RepID=A0AAN9A339_HALRR
MALKGSKRKLTGWVTPSFDDFEVSSSTAQTKRRPKGSGKKSAKGGLSLWVDLYAPTKRDDLAVHKKKIEEVETWIVEAMSGIRGRQFLLLSGPSGCGKSATMRVLAREAGLNLIEWINPTSSYYVSVFEDEESKWIPEGYIMPPTQIEVFQEFFLRTCKYSSVCEPSKKNNLVLIEDFPNVFLRDPSSLHTVLRKFRNVGSGLVVFIVTDTTYRQSSVKTLFPADIQQELSMIHIQFNAIANSILLKALNRILGMKSMCEGSGPIPSREALESLIEASGGDVRSSVNALQFAVKKDVRQLSELFSGTRKSKRLSKSKPRNGSKSSTVLLQEPQGSQDDFGGLAAVGGKDTALFLFRALGKILYCKRDTEMGIMDPLPKHLKAHERMPVLENAEEVYEKMAMGASTLNTFLHQNMTPFYADIDSVSQALHYMTDADVLASEWTDRGVLEDYVASVSVRGLMHANKGSVSSGGLRTFTRPQWFSVHKQHQEQLSALKYDYRNSFLSLEELTTVLVPLKAKVDAARGKGNFTVTRDVGLFTHSFSKSTAERLGEHDAHNGLPEMDEELCLGMTKDDDEISRNALQSNEELADDNFSNDDADEDFRIDEFPDD